MKKNYFTVLIVIMALVGCTRDYQEPQEKQEQQDISRIKNNSDIGQKTTLAELGYDSYEAMLDNGWEVIHKTEKYEPKKIKAQSKIITQSDAYYIKEKVSYYPHIARLGYNRENILNIFTEPFNIRPDGVTTNDLRTNNAPRELLSDRYGWHAYVETGTPLKLNEEILDNDGNTEFFWIYNESDQERYFERLLESNLGYKITTNMSATFEFKYKHRFNLRVISQNRSEFNVEVTVGKETENCETSSYTGEYLIKIPPHSKRKIVIKEKFIKSRMKYRIPIMFTGKVALNFAFRTQGHYYWSADAGLLVRGKDLHEIVTLDIEQRLDVNMIAGPAVPLKSYDF